MTDALSLTQDEARERAALLDVRRYDLDLDLTGLAAGDTLRATSTIAFSATDARCDDVRRLPRRGRGGRPQRHRAARVARRREVVSSCPTCSRQPPGRALGAAPDRGRAGRASRRGPERRRGLRLDELRARRRAGGLRLLRPARPQGGLRHHRPRAGALAGHEQHRRRRGHHERRRRAPGRTPTPRRCRRTSWWSTPDPSSSCAARRAGFDLGLYARRSLAPMLERDAEELFDITAKGLTFFGEQFAMPFPQPRYDQVFAPEMGGAMENYGCVTWSDTFVFRDPPSYAEREHACPGAAARDGAHVVRRHGDHAVVGRPVAQRVVRRVGVRLGGGRRAPSSPTCGPGCSPARSRTPTPPTPRPTTHPIRQRLHDVATARGHASTTSPTPRAPRCSSSSSRTSARTPSSPACAATSASTPGGTRRSTTWSWSSPTASGRDLTGWVEGWLETVRHRPPHRRAPTTAASRWSRRRRRAEDRCRTACGSVRTPTGGTQLALVEQLSVEVAGERTPHRVAPGGRPVARQRRGPHVRGRPTRRGLARPAALPRRRPADRGRPHARAHHRVEPDVRR